MPSARMEISLLLEQLGEASPSWLVASCDQPCGQHTAAPLPTLPTPVWVHLVHPVLHCHDPQPGSGTSSASRGSGWRVNVSLLTGRGCALSSSSWSSVRGGLIVTAWCDLEQSILLMLSFSLDLRKEQICCFRCVSFCNKLGLILWYMKVQRHCDMWTKVSECCQHCRDSHPQ